MKRIRRLAGLVVLACAFSSPAWTQSANSEEPYIHRGHETEARQRAYHDRMDCIRWMLADQLHHAAPDLLERLEPAPPKAYGYGILPRIIPDEPPKPPVKPEVVRFSWAWSDTLIAREEAALDSLEDTLARTGSPLAPAPRAEYEKLAAGYKARVDCRRQIDADVDYNWHWQKQIAGNRPLFDRLQARLDAELEQLTRAGASSPRDTPPRIDFDPPVFVRIKGPVEREYLISVPLYTDISDPRVVDAFVDAVETRWRSRSGGQVYRVHLDVTTLTAERLYCGDAAARQSTGPCTVPDAGDKIDLTSHAKRFPDGAVLTTGTASLQIIGGRALVLGPHDVSPRTLAHEFGHILGFPDTYLRGYRDLGADGFQVLELVADQSDIMSSISSGSVLAGHFQGLIAAREIQSEMTAGLTALYQDNQPAVAIARFRAVLARNPEHFGATFQLAKALDRAGQPDEALIVWKKMLEMAEAAKNTETAAAARARLAAAR